MRGLEYPTSSRSRWTASACTLASFGGERRFAASSENPPRRGDDVDGRSRARASQGGPHRITVAFLQKPQSLNTRRLQNYVRSSSAPSIFRYPHIDE